MPEPVPFHFLLLAVGEILKIYKYATPQKLQTYINDDDAFGVRVPLEQCRLALELLKNSHFVVENSSGEYVTPNV